MLSSSPMGPSVEPADPADHPSERHVPNVMMSDGLPACSKIFSSEAVLRDIEVKPLRSRSCGSFPQSMSADGPLSPGQPHDPANRPTPAGCPVQPRNGASASPNTKPHWPPSPPRSGPRGEPDGNPARRSLRRFSSASLTGSFTSSLGEFMSPESGLDHPSSLPTTVQGLNLMGHDPSFATPEKGGHAFYVPILVDKSLQETNDKLKAEVLMLSEEKRQRFSTLRAQAEDFGLLLVERERVQHEKVRRALEERVRALEDELAETQLELEDVRAACQAKDKENGELRALATNLAETLYGGGDDSSVTDGENDTPGRRRRRGAFVRGPLSQNCEVSL